MHNFCPGNPFTPKPFTMNKYPAESVNFWPVSLPVNNPSGIEPVVTNNISKFSPPNAAEVTISVGISIFCINDDFLQFLIKQTKKNFGNIYFYSDLSYFGLICHIEEPLNCAEYKLPLQSMVIPSGP